MRKPSAWYATREARAEWELRNRFEQLAEAAMAWRENGDFDRLEVALDALSQSPEYHGFPPLDEKLTRDERVAALAARYVSVGQFLDRMKRVGEQIDATRQMIGDEIRLASIEPDSVPEYVKIFWKRLSAEGIGQKDLHPGTRALAKAVAKAIREYNSERRIQPKNTAAERYTDFPVGSWSQLPRLFAGFELVDIEPDEVKDPEPCSLPPSTDIADFTEDRQRPPYEKDRLATYKAWSEIIAGWATRNGKAMSRSDTLIWAFLLAHRLPADKSDVKYFVGRELQSPWKAGGVTRVFELTADEWERSGGSENEMPKSAAAPHPRSLDDDDDDVPL